MILFGVAADIAAQEDAAERAEILNELGNSDEKAADVAAAPPSIGLFGKLKALVRAVVQECVVQECVVQGFVVQGCLVQQCVVSVLFNSLVFNSVLFNSVLFCTVCCIMRCVSRDARACSMVRRVTRACDTCCMV